MQILYGYSNCSDEKYLEIVRERGVSVLQPDQKFHSLIIKGLAREADVKCFSGLPINQQVSSRLLIHERDEKDGRIEYHYHTSLNVPVIRPVMIFFSSFFKTFFHKKTDDTVAVSDCLNIANSYGMLFASKIRRIPYISLVTDLPDMYTWRKKINRINNKIFTLSDGFIFLTEQMNDAVNQKKKPYIVVEGICDNELEPISKEGKFEIENGKKIVIYAGSIAKLYGIQNLTEGFIKADIPDAELWIYGDGDYRNELVEITKRHKSIVYRGICDNASIVEDERKAALLVNPRPSAPEYTKYSFPSKNMEYMASGTPVLTTDLPGIPREYLPYVYLIDREKENSDDIAKKLTEVLSKPFEEREAVGKSAHEFVSKQKSNIVQTRRMLEFFRGFLRENK